MAEENHHHIIPLAPTKFQPRSDEEFAIFKPKTTPKQKSSKCLVYFLLLIVIASAVTLIFATVVLRPKTPAAELSSVSIKNLKYYSSDNSTSTSSFFNFTLEAELSIKNPNFGSFKFEHSSCSVFYGAETVGKSRLNHGRVGAKETATMKVVFNVKLQNYYDDNGILKLSSQAKFNGKVHMLKFINRKRTAFLNCSMNLNLGSQSIQDLVCD